jgi:hypothetical protein
MKTILRILIILVVAAVIGGGTLLLVNNGSASGLGQGVGDNSLGRHLPGSGEMVPGAVPESFRQGRGPGHGQGLEGGAFSWSESIKNIGIVAVLIIVVALFERLIKAARTRKVARVAVSAPEPDGKEIPIE